MVIYISARLNEKACSDSGLGVLFWLQILEEGTEIYDKFVSVMYLCLQQWAGSGVRVNRKNSALKKYSPTAEKEFSRNRSGPVDLQITGRSTS